MKIENHNFALDEHSRIISSLSPSIGRDLTIRANLIVSLISESLPPETRKYLPFEAPEAFKFLNKLLGAKTMERELHSYIENELFALRQAQTIFCSEDIFDEVNEASKTILDTVILPQDAFTPHGIIFLEKPHRFIFMKQDIDNEFTISEQWDIYALLFTESTNRINKSGLAVMLYGQWRGINFYNNDSLAELSNTGTNPVAYPESAYLYDKETKSVKVILDGKQDLEAEKLLKRHQANISNNYLDLSEGKLSFVDGTFFQYGETDTNYDPEVLILKKLLLSFFRLTNQYLEIETTNADRPFQKRAKRAGRKIPDDGYITVMSLRRKLYDGETEGASRNSPGYAFRVRGHWKRQYVPSRKLPVGDPGAYKHLYINDYIKGRGVVVRSKRVVKVGN